MSFWCIFLDPDLTTYHSNMGVHIIVVFDVGIFFLDDGLVVEGGGMESSESGGFCFGPC